MQASKLPEFGGSSGSLLDLISHALAPEVRRMMISWTYSSRRYLDFEWSKGCSPVQDTERVQQLASNGESFEVSSRNLGLPPVPIPGKQLTVVYSLGRRQFRESAQEGETFRFKEAESFDRGEGLRVVRGLYGRSGSYTDVTEQLRDYAKRGESFRVSPEAFGLDAERAQGGHLRMTVIDRSGERVQREYEVGDYVDFR